MAIVFPDEIRAQKRHFSEKCKNAKMRRTPQRIALFDLLIQSHSHPTAKEAFDQISQKFPGISPSTVYKTLEKFVEIGVAKKIDIGTSAARFDARLQHHHHIIEKDGQWRDIEISDPIPLPNGMNADNFSEISIFFRR